MSWFIGVIKRRFDGFLATKFIGAAITTGVAILFPDIPDSTRLEIVAAIWAVYGAVKAYQNAKIETEKAKAAAIVESARIAGGGAVVPVKQSLEQFIVRLTAEGKSPSEIAKAIEAR